MEILLGGLGVAVLYSFLSLRVLRQYERGVTFFLGRYWGTKGPGVIFLPAGFAAQKRVSLRIVALALGVLSCVALAAGVIPAWRAARIDPALTLRME